jgi:hypothetical protein
MCFWFASAGFEVFEIANNLQTNFLGWHFSNRVSQLVVSQGCEIGEFDREVVNI